MSDLKKPKLTRKQIKLRMRLFLSFKYWFSTGKHVCWLTLGSSPASVDAQKDIWNSWQKMVLMIKRKFDIELEYCAINTSEGLGVLHIFLVTEDRLPKVWDLLRTQWSVYHLAQSVYIEEVGNDHMDAVKVSWYAVTQYASDQGTSFVKAMWSRFSFLPERPQYYLDKSKKALKDIEWVMPWHVKYKDIDKMAEDFMLGRVSEYKGHKLIMFGDNVDFLERPLDDEWYKHYKRNK